MAATSPEAWERFNRFAPEQSAVARDTSWVDVPREFGREVFGGAPVAAGGGLSMVLAEPVEGLIHSPLLAARRLLRLGLSVPIEAGEPRFRIASHSGARSGQTVTLQQQINGFDVTGATVKVQFGRSGDFVISSRALGALRARTPRTSVRTDPDSAGRSAAATLDLPASSVHSVELQCFPVTEDEGRWVWRTSLISEDPVADVRAYADAETLEVILSFNIASALGGRASIFPRNPRDTPAIERRLFDLGPTPIDQLAGTRLVVTPHRRTPLTRADRDFRVSQAQPECDEPNAFYHLRRALQYFTRLKGRRRRHARPPFRPVRAVVRHRPSRNNSFYLPDTGELFFGSFDVGSGALAAEILYHELGHAVSDNVSQLGRGLPHSQSRALSEGYSDYFAESALDNPLMLDWALPSAQRNSADPSLVYPLANGSNDEHAVGAVWAAMLWAIRSRVGPDADQIAYDSLSLVGPASGFGDGRRALQNANRELAAAGKTGDHRSEIDQEWNRRF